MTIKIIAEIGSVHDGSFGNALKLIDESKNAGADFVKFQYHIAEYESLKNAPSPSYFSQESRFDYFKRTSFSPSQWYELKKYANKKKAIVRKIIFFILFYTKIALETRQFDHLKLYQDWCFQS